MQFINRQIAHRMDAGRAMIFLGFDTILAA
jgi:hypothetical protein